MKPTEDKEQQPHSEQQENILDEQQQPTAQEGQAQQTEEQEQPVQEEPTTEEQLEKAKEEIAELNDRLQSLTTTANARSRRRQN